MAFFDDASATSSLFAVRQRHGPGFVISNPKETGEPMMKLSNGALVAVVDGEKLALF